MECSLSDLLSDLFSYLQISLPLHLIRISILSPPSCRRILEFCRDNADGITNEMFRSELGLTDVKLQSRLINKLLADEKITIHQKGNALLYKLNKAAKSKNDEEKIVLSIIENAGNKGIWTKDIRYKSNIPAIYLNKILKQMESKKLIKTVKSVNASKKKLYMLFDVEPDTSVTGGTWYSNQDFEVEFVDVLNEQCFRFLNERVGFEITLAFSEFD